MLKRIFLFLFLFLLAVSGFCLEIPINAIVEQRSDNSIKNKSANSIIFVDIEKVFNSHPMTLEYKKEIKAFIRTRKENIEDLIKAFNSLKEEAKSINLKISEAKSENRPYDELSKQLSDVNEQINNKKSEISDLSERTKTEVSLMEGRSTAEVLKDIESMLREELKKYEASIVLDKQGTVVTEKYKDVTDEVIKMAKDR
ncbi:MAG: OmpH family outer membrane protein [Endomicrobium sp.]|jgi:Skp family chaperone for outer membrane proteins|nr:OmpH family outer membrane protein [Endomicrobium sp.]